ncbi:CHRD domain-containing protein [Rhodopila sp.]|uniref:CHRD domain-containing protein n=1 Tax=Rhodopila sp. TaxID=2480087 RepID=UPI003D0E3D98
MLRRSLVFASIAIACAGSASAATEKFHATLAATSEVPPTKSTGSGEANATLDTATHELTYDVTFSGFTSAVAAAHFHGPAEPGKNAGVLVPLGTNPTSPIHGTKTLTAEQQRQLTSGMWYVNVHTKNNPSGAIRGQLMEMK